MATLEDAIEIAAQAHAGQVDKAGSPYILHPLRVMLRVEGVHERIAAVLHDIVEDTPMGFEELRLLGFPEEVLQAVCALTKKPGETRMMAAKRAAMDPIARAVKIADVTDNMNLSRIEQPTEHGLERQEEYKKVLALLSAKKSPRRLNGCATRQAFCGQRGSCIYSHHARQHVQDSYESTIPVR